MCSRPSDRSPDPLDAVEWEVLPPTPLPPAVQVAVDVVLLEALIAGRRGPTLRFWEWERPALVLGSNQVLANEVDLQEAGRLGFALVRRMSGGGTMIAEPGRTITYSLYAPASIVAGRSFLESFALLDAWVVDCLRDLGVPAGYRPINDIVSPDGKIGGAAQARRRGGLLHHAMLAHEIDPAVVPRLIRIGRDRVSARGVRSAARAVTPLSRYSPLARDQVVVALARCFRERYAARSGRLAAGELREARELAAAKYGTPAWTDRLS
jgi:lipoate-protein ligase A